MIYEPRIAIANWYFESGFIALKSGAGLIKGAPKSAAGQGGGWDLHRWQVCTSQNAFTGFANNSLQGYHFYSILQ